MGLALVVVFITLCFWITAPTILIQFELKLGGLDAVDFIWR